MSEWRTFGGGGQFAFTLPRLGGDVSSKARRVLAIEREWGWEMTEHIMLD